MTYSLDDARKAKEKAENTRRVCLDKNSSVGELIVSRGKFIKNAMVDIPAMAAMIEKLVELSGKVVCRETDCWTCINKEDCRDKELRAYLAEIEGKENP